MFDAGTRHRAAFNAHTPVAILALLLLVAIFAAVLAGHDMAGQGGFNWLHIVVFAAVVSLTIWVIYDLEMPRYGLIRIDNYDQTMLDLRDSIQRGP
jgi:protein-S-isoprenylcysteine O-methyltransferase Ste14